MSKGRPRLWVRILRSAGLTIVLLLLLGGVWVRLYENDLIYVPIRGDVGPSPGEDVRLTASDGVKIHGWYLAHPQAKSTILFFHGNAGNLENRRDIVQSLGKLPANVLAIDYRGYGFSEGSPDEQGLYLDAQAAWDWLCTRTTPDRIVILGKSLGGGPACELAIRARPAGLIVHSSFTRASEMAPRIIPWFPAGWFMKSRYDNLSKVAKTPCPKLFIHARNDEIIPFEMAERLFLAAAGPKEQAWFDAGGHNGVDVVNKEAYFRTIQRFLDGLAK